MDNTTEAAPRRDLDLILGVVGDTYAAEENGSIILLAAGGHSARCYTGNASVVLNGAMDLVADMLVAAGNTTEETLRMTRDFVAGLRLEVFENLTDRAEDDSNGHDDN